MMNSGNVFLPVGAPVPDWRPKARATDVMLRGSKCLLEPLSPMHHADALCAAYGQALDGRDWTYLSVGPFADAPALRAYLERIAVQTDPRHFAVVDLCTGQAVGTLALMREQAEHGVIEVGFVAFSPALQRSRIATEAHFLLMTYVFETLGNRRYEWKCDSCNQRSRNAAERLGFQYEGTFRQAAIYKSRNRDTAWFSLLDSEWPVAKAAFLHWLHPQNFNTHGVQISRLQFIRERIASSGWGLEGGEATLLRGLP